jgi:hypothetical protein
MSALRFASRLPCTPDKHLMQRRMAFLCNMPASDSESDFFCISLHYDRWLAYRRPSSPRLHGLCNEKCQSYHNCPRLPPTAHRLACRLPLRDPSHHPNNERLHVARRRHTAQNPPDPPLPYHQFPRHSRPATCKRTCFRFVLPFCLDGWTDWHTLEIGPASVFQAA